jgi:hypothetical protein
MNNSEINNKLESLVHNRCSKDELNKKLTQMFGCDVVVEEYDRPNYVENFGVLDDQFLFTIENDNINLAIDVDLYYLKDNSGNYYITETNFEYQ